MVFAYKTHISVITKFNRFILQGYNMKKSIMSSNNNEMEGRFVGFRLSSSEYDILKNYSEKEQRSLSQQLRYYIHQLTEQSL